MRLIDADALIDSVRIPMIDRLTNAIQLGQEYLYMDVPSITLSQISIAPTIEAIPVEWIEEYIADETNGRKIELHHIRRMLEAWREEHEIG